MSKIFLGGLRYANKRRIVQNWMRQIHTGGRIYPKAWRIGISSGIVKKKMIDDNKFEEITALAKLYTSKL